MGQAEIMVALEHRELMLHAVLALAQCVDSTADGCYPLADVEVESLNKGGVDLPTTHRQDLLDSRQRAEHHAVLDLDKAAAPVRLHDLRIEEPGQGHPARLWAWPLGLPTRRLYPLPIVGEQGRQILPEPISQKERRTVGGQHLRNVVDYALSHRQGARSAIDDQEQLALRIDGRPHPVPGTLQAFDGFLCADLAIFDAAQHGVQLVELQLVDVHVAEK